MYDDLERPPLNEQELRHSLVENGPWRELRVVSETGSTNADVAAAALDDAAEGLVIVAEHQTAGRGRLDRSWQAPARSGLTFSVLLRPDGVPVSRWGWLPLLAGTAVAMAVLRTAEVEAQLKWPNDVLVGERKLAGLLAERAGGAVVLGVGINVGMHSDELPVPTATSLHVEGAATTDRTTLLRSVLRELTAGYAQWLAADGGPDSSGARPAYERLCTSLGRSVEVQTPGGVLAGLAERIDEDGRLVVDGRPVAAGDVVHLR